MFICLWEKGNIINPRCACTSRITVPVGKGGNVQTRSKCAPLYNNVNSRENKSSRVNCMISHAVQYMEQVDVIYLVCSVVAAFSVHVSM